MENDQLPVFGHLDVQFDAVSTHLAIDPLAMAVPWQSQWLHHWLDTYLELRDEHWTVEELFKMYPPPTSKGP